MTILVILTIVFFAAYLGKKSLYYLHMMQQNSYRNDRFCHWLKTKKSKLSPLEVLPLVVAVLLIFLPQFDVWAMLVMTCIYALLFFTYRRPQQKKALVMTARAKRLFIATLVILLLLSIILCFGMLFFDAVWIVIIMTAIIYFSFGPIILANLLIAPLEKRINEGFLQDARRIISSLPFLTTIGITGSYGKTSCKFVLGEILSEQFMTLITPQSYNTPMGITRVIREMLRPTHEMFVTEMGAKQKGDIEELCHLVQPKVGILTSIGEQHLESFGSLENIIETKYELIENLPPDGLAVLNLDDPNIASRAGLAPCRVVSYGLDPKWDYYADDIHYGSFGCRFTLHAPDGQKEEFSTILLGKYAVYNILAATAAAHQLGVSLAKASAAVRRLPPVEHRLQLRPTPVYTIIDDAFNSNPKGAEQALEVLASFDKGKKIIITPGMVELGERQNQLNYQFALAAAGVCDYIILVGPKHTLPMQEALSQANYPLDRMYVAANLDDARSYLATVAAAGDTVLFENDLPDTYNE